LPELPETLNYLECRGNNLPFNSESYCPLKSYWIWYYNKYPERLAAKKYNL